LNKTVFCLALLLMLPGYAQSETHELVQQALDYELPVNDCERPEIVVSTATVTDGGGQTRTQTDADSYTIARYERKENRWQTCVEEYREGLMADFEKLKSSAQHGLTQAQADIIVGKMALLQEVYFSPDGLIDDPEE
jgi:hypothetical protein